MEENRGSLFGIIFLIGLVVLCIVFPAVLYIGLGLIGLVVLIIIIALIRSNIKKKKARNISIVTGVTQGMIDDYVASCEKQILEIRKNLFKIKHVPLRNLVNETTKKLRQILTSLKDDPTDFKQTRRFMDSLLPSVANIINQTLKIAGTSYSNDAIDSTTLENLMNSFEDINTACDTHLINMTANNALNLDVELDVLNQTLEARGLLKNEE